LPPRFRLVAVDDHPLYLAAIADAARMRADFELVLTAPDGRRGLAAIRQATPDLALVDLVMPLLDGFAVAGAVRRDRLPTKIVILSAREDGEAVYAAMEAGAFGYLSKRADVEEIFDSLVRVGRDEIVIGAGLSGGLAFEIRRRGGSPAPILTAREAQVLAMVSDGCSAPQVAGQLHLGLTTVKTHLTNIYAKLGVSDRAAAVATALRHGLIQ
jgi:two-component system nitrate/nitrite response regulator NarL